MKIGDVVGFVKKKNSERLTSEEKQRYLDIVLVSNLERFKTDFAHLKKIPTHIPLVNDSVIRAFVSEEKLIAELPKLKEELNAQFEERKKLEEEARQQAIEVERNKSYFDFWHYRGIVYSASKYKDRSGEYIYPVTEFFLKRNNQPDHDIKLYGYDVAIANGHDVCVIYARKNGQSSGYAVQYVNMTMNRSITLTGNLQKVNKATMGMMADESRIVFELNRFRARI